MRWAIATLLFPAVLAAAAERSPQPTLYGRIVGVTDGDTVKLLTQDKRILRIRLAEIDAPESHQPYGERSKRELSRLVFSKVVQARVTAIDRYGRSVARLQIARTDVSAEMVRRGAAWVFVKYSTDPRLPPLERGARLARIGLWSLQADQRQAPWEWREAHRIGRSKRAPRDLTGMRVPMTSVAGKATHFACASKRFCTQMTSCDEAIYHLRVCGQVRLDRDGDGKPCEKLCG